MGTPAFFEILSVDRKEKNYKKKQASQKALVLSLSNESSDGQFSTSEQVSNSQNTEQLNLFICINKSFSTTLSGQSTIQA